MADCKTTTATSPELNRPLRSEAEARAAIRTPLTPDQRGALSHLGWAFFDVQANMDALAGMLGYLADLHEDKGGAINNTFYALENAAEAIEKKLEGVIQTMHRYRDGEIILPPRDEEGGAA